MTPANQNDCSFAAAKVTNQGRWTKEEHANFEMALQIYGKDWQKIEDLVATRSSAQIRSHAQKYCKRLESEGQGFEFQKELQTNLRSMTKTDRILYRTEKKDELATPAFGLTNAEFLTQYKMQPYQHVFKIQKVDPASDHEQRAQGFQPQAVQILPNLARVEEEKHSDEEMLPAEEIRDSVNPIAQE
jgi:SHAQKYF class myb-like DNA-binding protein